jgi:hypothetical protein
VFALASDFAGAPSRVRGIVRVEMLCSGPVGVGTRFRETRVCFGREATEEMEVVELDPPRRYALACESCGCRFLSELRFTPRGSGTALEMAIRCEPQTWVARIMSVLMRPFAAKMTNEIARDLQDIKAAAEGAPPPADAPAARPA